MIVDVLFSRDTDQGQSQRAYVALENFVAGALKSYYSVACRFGAALGSAALCAGWSPGCVHSVWKTPGLSMRS